ncbi:tetratricopeptide repeat protein [Nitratidesulfovibrio termitidis]|uniref:tetratricopeptide repeat protein n=1 Tax=Nitratidesulfovibrio termitidis TaxID=42252 RepID=UPI0018DB7E59|nr:tetratricopeptide repeat protein [Nitratidesulfovibrio termitidis]
MHKGKKKPLAAKKGANLPELFHRAISHHKNGQLQEALTIYDRILALKHDHVDAHTNRSVALRQMGRYAESLASCDRAIALKPDYARAHCERGIVLTSLGRHDEALASYDRAIALKPDLVVAHGNRAGILYEMGRYAEAVAGCDRIIARRADDIHAHHNRANALLKLGRYDEALAGCNRVIALDPQHASAWLKKALMQLLLGNYAKGLVNYEWRWRCTGELGPRDFMATLPQWHGEPIADKTILLHAEQGLGDSIQMLRYLPLVKARAARVLLEVPETVQPLLGPLTDGVPLLTRRSLLPSFDVHCPLMSLPLAFGTRPDTIPAPVPYLTVPAGRMATWRSRLPKSTRSRVGLVWSGSTWHLHDRERSIALDRLAPLLRLPGISFLSLQREYRDTDLPALARLPIERIDGALADLGDTAAAIGQCDLVISVDTAVAHLAGSLGRPLWLLLPYVPDWRWLLGRADSPWYPGARLFRQDKPDDWESVIADVANELPAFVAGVHHAGRDGG